MARTNSTLVSASDVNLWPFDLENFSGVSRALQTKQCIVCKVCDTPEKKSRSKGQRLTSEVDTASLPLQSSRPIKFNYDVTYRNFRELFDRRRETMNCCTAADRSGFKIVVLKSVEWSSWTCWEPGDNSIVLVAPPRGDYVNWCQLTSCEYPLSRCDLAPTSSPTNTTSPSTRQVRQTVTCNSLITWLLWDSINYL